MKKAIYALLSITIYLYSPLLGRTPEQILGKFTLQNETPYDFDGFNVLVVNEAYKKIILTRHEGGTYAVVLGGVMTVNGYLG